MKYWEIIADNLSKAGWIWGCVATVDSNGQTIFVADAHRDNGKRFQMPNDSVLKVKGLAHFETSISVPYFDKRTLRPWQMKNISKY